MRKKKIVILFTCIGRRVSLLNSFRRACTRLGYTPGVVTIQCFLSADAKMNFIEINPRFGGGVPLAIKAGADLPRWILQLWLGQNPRIHLDHWRDQLVMLCYDEAVWRH